MKVLWGPIPSGRNFEPEAVGSLWRRLVEPTPTQFAFQAIALAVPLVGVSLVLLFASADALRADRITLVAFLVFLAAMIPLHELVHGLAFPRSLASPNIIFGVWLSRGICYVTYDGPTSRDRLLIVLAMPFAVFTLGIFAGLLLVESDHRSVLALMFTIHTATCVGDLLTFIRITRQVPRNAQLQNHGWQTWWRE
ncbi:MAG: DUF3267 domain-containing protein [Planctomycetota bacterium]